MADESNSLKWHEIINHREGDNLQFLDLYREYADALKEKARLKAEKAFWPYPKE